MAHSGCACHASLPRHRFHSILPPAPEIHNSQHKSRHARNVVQDQVASNPAVELPASSRLSHEAHEYHHGCRHSVEKIQISELPEKFLTIIPAELDEACFQVLAPQLGESLTEKMRAILCSTGNAPLYCTPARNGGTVYWIAQTFSPINERAVRATGVSGISGDAVLVENAEYGPLQLARLSQVPAAMGKNESPSTIPASMSNLNGEKQPAQGSGSKRSSKDEVLGPEAVNGGCVQSECSLKRGLTAGPEASETFHTVKCGPSQLGDPLVKRQRACSDEPSKGECEYAPALSSRLPGLHEGQAAGAGNVDTSASAEPIHHSSSSVDRIESMGVNPVDEFLHQKLRLFVDAPQQDPPPNLVGGISRQPEDSTLLSAHASRSCVDTDLEGRGFPGGSEKTVDYLSIGELQMIFSFMGFLDLSTASAVCKLWRTSIAEDEPLLKNLPIRRRMFQPAIVPPAPRRTKFLCDSHPLPFVLMKAAEVGNVPAMVLVAEEMERQGRRPKALEWWKKAARKGDQGSQYRVGEAYYRGDSEWPQDGEEALIWLNRAAKYVNGDKGLSGAAGLLLGYMHLDGEGIAAPDNTEAVRWFRFAAELGNREAEKTVGWLWNTGQF